MVTARILPLRRALALVVLASVAVGCAHRTARPPRSTSNAVVPVITAAVGIVAPRRSLSGLVAPLQNIAITSTLAEPADEIYVEEGDRVRRGQVLAVLDTADLRAQLASDLSTAQSSKAKAEQTFDQAGLTIAQSSNSINAAAAAVRQAEQILATDRVTLTRDASLLRSGYVAQSQYDAQATQVKNDEQAVRAARVTLQNGVTQVHANGTTSRGLQGATVAAARADEQTALAQANQVRVQIAKATIVSSIDGVVVNRNLNPGEFPGTRQLFTVQQTDRVYAVLNGAGSQITGIRNRARVRVTAPDIPGRSLDGTVVGVLNAAQPGSTIFVVKVLVENHGEILRPGMVVSGTTSLPVVRGMRIPSTAFLDTTNSSVLSVREGVIHTVPVTMLAEDDKNAIVAGLLPGATIVANGQLGLSDGQPVATQRVAKQ
ncbi:MAG: efflux transporter, family, subunit [Candidatus Eremiobacteraeota bacterium]|nr:efflux transporter, family, subunit [Candidatus Eremiobacteraeota bacterium]